MKREWIKLLLAFLLPPAAMVLSGWTHFQLGFAWSELTDWLVLVVPMLVGVALIATLPRSRSYKIATILIYVPAMIGVIFWTGIITSCFYGDCL